MPSTYCGYARYWGYSIFQGSMFHSFLIRKRRVLGSRPMCQCNNGRWLSHENSRLALERSGIASPCWCGCSPLFFGFVRQLSAMPYRHDPYGIILNFIKKTIRTYNNFTKWKVRKFRYWSPRLGKLLESKKRFFRFLTEFYCRRRLVTVNIGNSFKELAAACGCK